MFVSYGMEPKIQIQNYFIKEMKDLISSMQIKECGVTEYISQKMHHTVLSIPIVIKIMSWECSLLWLILETFNKKAQIVA